MSWQIPTQIEQDIINGKATYRTFQTGNGGQSILPVPANAYVVIFGYDFSPAGGGVIRFANIGSQAAFVQNSDLIRWFETQQISFYTGTDFYPFIHHVDVKSTISPLVWDETDPATASITTYRTQQEVVSTPISRQVYITSSNDVTITHGLIQNSTVTSVNAIPVTSRTPEGLTYGGNVQTMNTQTDYGPGVSPLQFMQPSPKDYQDFGFGLLPNNADGQAFATPSPSNGLAPAYTRLLAFSGDVANAAASNYYLCLHYALYNKPITEQQG